MTLAIQDRYFPEMTCFGCGPANEKGLRLKSYAGDNGLVTATFAPWAEHDNGLGFLNGGIIATVLDCHSGAVMVHEANEHGWSSAGAPLPFVTAGLDVRYRRPTPLAPDGGLTLVGEVVRSDESEIVCAVRVEYDGKVRAEAEALWKRWRPR